MFFIELVNLKCYQCLLAWYIGRKTGSNLIFPKGCRSMCTNRDFHLIPFFIWIYYEIFERQTYHAGFLNSWSNYATEMLSALMQHESAKLDYLLLKDSQVRKLFFPVPNFSPSFLWRNINGLEIYMVEILSGWPGLLLEAGELVAIMSYI